MCEQKLFCSHNFFFIPPPTPTFRQKLYSQLCHLVWGAAKVARGGLRFDLKVNVQTRGPRNNNFGPLHGEMQLKTILTIHNAIENEMQLKRDAIEKEMQLKRRL